MKRNRIIAAGALLALALAGLCLPQARAATAAAPTPLIDTRPVTPQDLKDYSLTGQMGASGLSTVPIKQPVYLETLWDITATNVTSITWTLTSKPGSSITSLTTSPLGANVPAYKPADRVAYKVLGRTVLTPDVPGQYVVSAAITLASGGTSNLTKSITAGTYMGLNTCALCHSGGVVASNKVEPWSHTLHATKLTRAIDGHDSDHYSKNCISCHTLGYNANTNAQNGGFDDVAAQLGWSFPTNLVDGNWAAMPAELKNLANIQCESCHGPGSEHAYSLGNTNRISVSWNVGNCAQCHDSKNQHYRVAEWNTSKHAISTRAPSGAGREGCVGCHTAMGFAGRIAGAPTTNTTYEAINCDTCHNAHDATNPYQLRTVADVKLLDNKTTVKGAGTGALCMSCHMSRRDATNYVEVTAGGSTFGPHEGPQADMFVGANAITYGKEIPSSAHRDVITNSCVACHMQNVAATSPAFTHAGGHTFNVAWAGDTTNAAVELTSACTQCHGPIGSFDFKRQDYDGDGVVEGVQTEVKHLLDQLGMLLPPIGSPTVTPSSSYTKPQLKALYNYKFVLGDGSYGVHNVSYAVGLLKASIADLTDDADHDGLSDKWEIAKFGSITAYNGNDDPDKDGCNNALEFAAGTNPLAADTDGDGMNDMTEMKAGSDPMNSQDMPGFVVKVYSAAEIEFASETGKKYQVQRVSSLTGTWQNIGSVTNGTGANISMVTSTRTGNTNGFFRVVQVP